MGPPGIVVVWKQHDIGAAESVVVARVPLIGAARASGGIQAQVTNGMDILFTLADVDCSPLFDGIQGLPEAVEYASDAVQVPDQGTVRPRPSLSEILWFKANHFE